VCEPGCDGAEEVELPVEIVDELTDPANIGRYYKFTVDAPQFLVISTDAKPDSDEFDPAYPDLVVTVLSEDGGTRFARNDDPSPRTTNDPFIGTYLPAAGTYCLEIAECNKVFGTENCADAEDIRNTEFSAIVYDPTLLEDVFFQEVEANNAVANATPVAFSKNDAGTAYSANIVAGVMGAASDADWFTFTVPNDLTIDGDRPVFSVDFTGGGIDGDGSTLTTAGVQLFDATGTTLVASAPMNTDYSIGAPVVAGSTYAVKISLDAGVPGSNPFYFLSFAIGTGNPLESEPNNGGADTDTLTSTTQDGITRWFTEGDLAPGDSDVFTITRPNGPTHIGFVCGGNAIGSGLVGLTGTLKTQSDATIGSDVDAAGEFASLNETAIPANTTTITLTVTATGQSGSITGSYYRCGVYALTPE